MTLMTPVLLSKISKSSLFAPLPVNFAIVKALCAFVIAFV